MTNEEFYDAEVAPQLLVLAKACKDRGMSFVASVEYAPDETGETVQVAADAGIKSIMAGWGIKAHGNVDVFMMAAEKHAKANGHGSVYLSMRGIPMQPPVSSGSAE